MRKWFLPVPLLLSFQLVTGQVYFDQLYGSESFGEGFGNNAVLHLEDGFLGWGFSYGNQKPYFAIVDSDGSILNGAYFDGQPNLSDLCFSVIQVADSIFVGLSLQEDQELPSSIRGDYGIYRFTVDGIVLASYSFGDTTLKEIPQNLIETTDGGFLLIGQKQFPDSMGLEGQMHILRIDSLGVQQWEATYGAGDWETGSSAVQTSDSGYLLLGWTRSYGAGQRDFYLIKTDSAGNDEWFETYGTAAEEIGKSILRLSDGNYLLTGSGTNAQLTESMGRLYKVEPDGDIIWSHTYSYENNTGHNLHKTLEMWNGDLVSVGMTSLTSNAGWLVKTDSLGEVIWQREYDKNESTDLFYSLLATDDGGFLLSGQAVNEETNSQDAWLLKVDSMGCTFPNCIVGMDEAGSKEIMVDVWPNPTSEVLHVQKMNDSETLTFSVFDMNGNEVLNQMQYDAHGSIDVSKWAAGIYIMNGFSDKNTFFSLKFMKQ